MDASLTTYVDEAITSLKDEDYKKRLHQIYDVKILISLSREYWRLRNEDRLNHKSSVNQLLDSFGIAQANRGMIRAFLGYCKNNSPPNEETTPA